MKKNKKNKGGRPPLNEGERTVALNVSVTPDQYRKFMGFASIFETDKSKLWRHIFDAWMKNPVPPKKED